MRIDRTNKTTEKVWSVYLHTVPKEITGYSYDKYYVGITSKMPEDRWGKHGKNYYGQIFYRAIQKYGWDNIIHQVLETGLTLNEANAAEIYYIEQYNSIEHGYNITPGGYLTSNACKKPIAQYSLNGELIQVFSSREQALKAINVHTKHQAIDTDEHTVRYGYQWRDILENESPPSQIAAYEDINRCKKINQYDIHGNFIKTWNTVKEASDYYNTYGIQQALDGTCKTSMRFQWRYYDQDDRPLEDLESLPARFNKQIIYCYDMFGNFLKQYNGKNQIIQELRVTKNRFIINEICKDITNNEFEGYRWTLKYFDRLPPLRRINSHPVVQLNDKTNVIINIHLNHIKASKFLGKGHNSLISSCCMNKRENVFGYRWQYIEDIDGSVITDPFLLELYMEYLSLWLGI